MSPSHPSRPELQLALRGARMQGALIVTVELALGTLTTDAHTVEVAPGLPGEIVGCRDGDVLQVNVAVADLAAWLDRSEKPQPR